MISLESAKVTKELCSVNQLCMVINVTCTDVKTASVILVIECNRIQHWRPLKHSPDKEVIPDACVPN